MQRILAGWDPGLTRVEVRAPSAGTARARTDGRGVGSFFSGGVDSFDTLLAHRDEITHLIFLEGFDFVVDARTVADRAAAAAASVASELGKELITVSTDVRRVFPHVEWRWWHGGCLAAAALLLQEHLHTVYIPGSASWSELLPWGSHPDIDPLWSTECLEFRHDGIERDRFTKVAALADGARGARSPSCLLGEPRRRVQLRALREVPADDDAPAPRRRTAACEDVPRPARHRPDRPDASRRLVRRLPARHARARPRDGRRAGARPRAGTHDPRRARLVPRRPCARRASGARS